VRRALEKPDENQKRFARDAVRSRASWSRQPVSLSVSLVVIGDKILGQNLRYSATKFRELED
jgi:hypothetical protein